MKIPQVINCCFCVGLKSGAQALGWAGAFICPLVVFYYLWELGEYLNVDEDVENILDTNEHKENDIVQEYLESEHDSVAVLGYLLLIIIFLVGCISSILLILGLRNHNENYVGQWLIVFIIVVAVEVLKELIDVCLAEDGLIVTLIYISLLLGFGSYFWLSIFNLYDALRVGVPMDLIGI